MNTPPGIDLSFLDEAPEPRVRARPVAVLDPAPMADWDAAVAIQLQEATDAVVERLGVSGLDPVIQTAAARCVEAHRRRDLSGVRAACGAIRVRAAALSVRN